MDHNRIEEICMEKVLIISDSHGLTTELKSLTEKYASYTVIHCGDSELTIGDPVINNMHVVRGNCDFDQNMPDEKVISVAGVNIFVTHGHLYGVGRDLTTLSYKASEYDAQIVCYGHTHQARAEKIGNQIFINPGSIRSPRDRKEITYAILTIEDGKHIQVEFHTTDGQILNELSFSDTLS